MNRLELAKEVKLLIADGKLDVAFDTCRTHVSHLSNTFLNELTQLEARFQEVETNFKTKNLIAYADYERVTAQIREGFLTLLDKLENTPAEPAMLVPKDKSKGRLMHNIPSKMPFEQDTRCVVRIAYDDITLMRDFKPTADTVTQSVRVAEVMGVELVDFNETPAFKIRTVNEEEQYIVTDEYTQWLFAVKPLRQGTFPLTLKVTVIEQIDGKERKRDIVLEKEIFIVTAHQAAEVEAEEPSRSMPSPSPAPVAADEEPAAAGNTPEDSAPRSGKLSLNDSNVLIFNVSDDKSVLNQAVAQAEPPPAAQAPIMPPPPVAPQAPPQYPTPKKRLLPILSVLALFVCAAVGLRVVMNQNKIDKTPGNVVIADDKGIEFNPNDTAAALPAVTDTTKHKIYAQVAPDPPMTAPDDVLIPINANLDKEITKLDAAIIIARKKEKEDKIATIEPNPTKDNATDGKNTPKRATTNTGASTRQLDSLLRRREAYARVRDQKIATDTTRIIRKLDAQRDVNLKIRVKPESQKE